MIVKEELTPEEMDNVNGGVIVHLHSHYCVCDDETGKLLDDVKTWEEAKRKAAERGVSGRPVIMREFAERYPDSWANPHHR